MLLEVTVDEPDELSVASKLLSSLTRNLQNELAAAVGEHPNFEQSKIKGGQDDPKELLLTPNVIKPDQFTFEVRKILN